MDSNKILQGKIPGPLDAWKLHRTGSIQFRFVNLPYTYFGNFYFNLKLILQLLEQLYILVKRAIAIVYVNKVSP